MAENPANVIACLTPPGQGALATLGLAGPTVWAVVRSVFQARSTAPLPDVPRPGQFWLGRCGGEVADDVVLAVRPASFEIHCHGGRAVLQLLLDLFTAKGFEVCSWQDFLLRCVRRDSDADPRAAVALAHAVTTRTAVILLDQYHGAFANAVARALTALDRGDLAAARPLIGGMARYVGLGRNLTAPWRVAVAGAPNVGKSSLINALVGYERSVVAPTPGTTRDVVTARIAVDGFAVELADTAGLRTDAGPLEGQGIELARRAVAEANLTLWVVDAATQPVWPETQTWTLRIVVNKIDLPAAWDLNDAGDAPHVSAATGQGMTALADRLACWLVPEAPPAGAAVPFTRGLCDAIEETERLLAAGEIAEARRVVGALV